MSLTLSPVARQQFFDNSGLVVANGYLYTYAAGTTTAQATYADAGMVTANTNPIQLNSAGRPTSNGVTETGIFLLASSYKFVLKTSAGVTLWTQDNVTSVPFTNVDTDVAATAGEALTAGQCAYLSDGSNSKTAGQWYLADADFTYASTTPEIGFVVSDIASGATGTVRIAGRLTGLSGLTPGALYYVSATAGSITATAPANRRAVGQADSITTLIVATNPAQSAPPQVCQGRLTLTTGVPVTTTDVTAATTLYFAPYAGNQIALYDGTAWYTYNFSQLSIAVPATTSQMYDVFVYNNSGTLTMELTAWTNDTTRATALAFQNGVYVKSGTTTRRYLGSFRTTAVSGQTEDSARNRLLDNAYNRVTRTLLATDSTSAWTYGSPTIRQARATTTNQVNVVVGLSEEAVNLTLAAAAASAGAAGSQAGVMIGYDTTSAATTGALSALAAVDGANGITPIGAALMHIPAVGYHYYSWNESTDGTTFTFYGLNAPRLSGLTGTTVK